MGKSETDTSYDKNLKQWFENSLKLVKVYRVSAIIQRVNVILSTHGES